jgi:cytochrome P450
VPARQRAQPPPAFGSGVPICAGLNVARLEGRIAIGRFPARFPGYRLAGERVRGGRTGAVSRVFIDSGGAVIL